MRNDELVEITGSSAAVSQSKGALQNSGYSINQLAGVTPVWPDELRPRKAGDQPSEYLFGSIGVLDPGRMKHRDQKQTKDVGDYMALATQDALAYLSVVYRS